MTCELTDLLAEMCSHCKGLDTKTEPRAAERSSEAQWPSGCPECGKRIQPGDIIGLVDGDWLCSDCAA